MLCTAIIIIIIFCIVNTGVCFALDRSQNCLRISKLRYYLRMFSFLLSNFGQANKKNRQTNVQIIIFLYFLRMLVEFCFPQLF